MAAAAPQDAAVRTGCRLAEGGDPAGAVAHFERAVAARSAPDARTLEMLAQCYLETQEFGKALAAAEKAASVAPLWADCHQTLGRVLFNQGRAPEALREFSTCLSLGGECEGLEEDIADANDLAARQIAQRVGLQELHVLQDVGCVAWESGIALAEFLTMRKHGTGGSKQAGQQGGRQQVLELGSGIGTAGIAAALLGDAVVLTDIQGVLPTLSKNVDYHDRAVRQAGGTAQVAKLDWSRPDKELLCRHYNLLLGADLIFNIPSIQILVDVLQTLLMSSPGMAVVFAHKSRSMEVDHTLFNSLKAIGLTLQIVARSLHDPAVSVYERVEILEC